MNKSVPIVIGKFLSCTGVSGTLTMMFKQDGYIEEGVKLTLDAGSSVGGRRLSQVSWTSDCINTIATVPSSSKTYKHEDRFVTLWISKNVDKHIFYPEIVDETDNDEYVLASAKKILGRIERDMEDIISFLDISLLRIHLPRAIRE